MSQGKKLKNFSRILDAFSFEENPDGGVSKTEALPKLVG
jgi:hypothetical protein